MVKRSEIGHFGFCRCPFFSTQMARVAPTGLEVTERGEISRFLIPKEFTAKYEKEKI